MNDFNDFDKDTIRILLKERNDLVLKNDQLKSELAALDARHRADIESYEQELREVHADLREAELELREANSREAETIYFGRSND